MKPPKTGVPRDYAVDRTGAVIIPMAVAYAWCSKITLLAHQAAKRAQRPFAREVAERSATPSATSRALS